MFSRALRRVHPTISLCALRHHHYASVRVLSRTALPDNNSTHENKTTLINYTTRRCKKSSSSKKKEDSDGEDWESDPTLARDSRLVKFQSPSMRMDIILKNGLGIARNKIEKIFYESKVRVNGKKVTKKSVTVHEGDEIDVIRSVSEKNPSHLFVSRVEILSVAAADDDEGITVSARRFKSLLVDNYKEEPYKPTVDDNH